MLKKSWWLLKKHFIAPFKEQQGQGFVILAGSFVALVAMLGLAIDLGMVYIERVRINSTIDAAVLASASELPFEEEAINRAISYLKENGYEVGKDVAVKVRGCVTTPPHDNILAGGGNVSEKTPVGPNGITTGVPQLAIQPTDKVEGAMYIDAAEKPARVTFMIDTGSFRGLTGAENTDDKPANLCQASTKDYGSSYRIEVKGSSDVEMNFMRLLGFQKVAVSSLAVAQSISSLDIMVVFDASASMEFDTACVDCWVKTKAWLSDSDIENYPYPDGNGYFNPIPFPPKFAVYDPNKNTNSIPNTELCKPRDDINTIDANDKPIVISMTVPYEIPSYVITETNDTFYYYSLHEAELYSANYPQEAWNLSQRLAGQGFWSIQRGSMREDDYQYNQYEMVLDKDIYNQGEHRQQYFYQGNQAGNPANQSANVCHMGVDDQGNIISGIHSGQGGTVIDCTMNNPALEGKQICELDRTVLSGTTVIYPTDCSAYIQAKPFVSYDSMKDTSIVGAAYDENCFPLASGNKCWQDDNFPSEPPYVEFDFTNRPEWGDETTVWIRAIGGGDLAYAWNGSPNPAAGTINDVGPGERDWWQNTIFWQVGMYDDSGTWVPQKNEPDENNLAPLAFSSKGSNRYPYGRDSRALNGDWEWIKLGTVKTDELIENANPPTGYSKQYTLRLYQGSAGYKVDRVMFTNDTEDKRTTEVLDQNGGRGPKISRGTATRESCNICNPAYGWEVTAEQCSCKKNGEDGTKGTGSGCTVVPNGQLVNQLNNDLYAGPQPFRSAQQAVKRFTEKLDPKFDQVGFISFSNDVDTDATVRAKLQCRMYTSNGNEGYNSGNCFTSNAITYTKVIQAIENQWPLNGTNTAAGLREGLEELGVSTPNNPADNDCTATADDGHSCSRGDSARKILILITDGIPTSYPGDPLEKPIPSGSNICASGVAPGQKIWQGSPDNLYYQCAMYYAYYAAQENVAVYTIGLGGSADPYLLTAIATGSYVDANGQRIDAQPAFKGLGKFYPAASPLQLDSIFEDILSQIYIDIVG